MDFEGDIERCIADLEHAWELCSVQWRDRHSQSFYENVHSASIAKAKRLAEIVSELESDSESDSEND